MTRGPLPAGQAPGDGPSYTDQGFAGVPGDIAAVTVAAAGSGSTTLRVLTIRGVTVVQDRLAIGISAYGGIAVWPLAPDAILVLVRDLGQRAGVNESPVLALRVPLG